MSRIHEALKKAEQERAANLGGAVQPNSVTTPMADPQLFNDAPRSGAPAMANVGMPAFGSPFSSDTLLARCPQMEWKPDL